MDSAKKTKVLNLGGYSGQVKSEKSQFELGGGILGKSKGKSLNLNLGGGYSGQVKREKSQFEFSGGGYSGNQIPE